MLRQRKPLAISPGDQSPGSAPDRPEPDPLAGSNAARDAGGPSAGGQADDEEARVSAPSRTIADAHGDPEPGEAGSDAATGPDAAPERRQEDRRQKRPDRAYAIPVPPAFSCLSLPARWHWLAAVFLVVIGACSEAAIAPPAPRVWLGFGVAIGILLLWAWARPWLEGQIPRIRIAVALAGAALPLLVFGLGITSWAAAGGLGLDAALAAIIAISILAGGLLRRHPVLQFAAQMAAWIGLIVWLASPVALAAGALAAVLGLAIAIDQLAEQRAEETFRQANERAQTRARDILADYEQTGQGWFWETDRRSLLTYLSIPVANVLGHRAEDLLGQPLTGLFALEQSGAESQRTLLFHLSARSSFSELAMRAATAKEERWWSVSGRPMHDRFGNFVGFRGSGTDLTEKRRSQENATRLARYDSLTGLANRLQMSQSLDKILASPNHSTRRCAVMLIDLDRFKQVNDTMGHPVGDALLRQVAQRLERAVGRTGQVGRLGGDEFQVIVPTRLAREALGNLAEKIIHSLSEPYAIEGQRVVIGASVGIALAPDDAAEADLLIRNADLALYAAKDAGRGCFRFYSQDLHADAEARARMEEELRDAIAQGGLQLYYQPVVNTASEQISGFEALLRWQHPENGWISPEKFVPVAEDSGLISQIGEWALRQACHDLASWPQEVSVAINVSPLQFSNPQLPAIVTSAIASAGIDPARLELEITESVFLADDADTDAMFAALKRVGVRLALDDFGTGYSSLGYLKKAPFDKIKIDQGFVRGAAEKGSRNGAIIASITRLAQALGMDTTAEGVETHDELELVRHLGCSHVQGYIYDRPLTAHSARARLDQGLAAVARGPRSARAQRHKMLRKVVLDHQGQHYEGTIRNISVSGALIEGLWNVPAGTSFLIRVTPEHAIACTARWSTQGSMGVKFDRPLKQDGAGQVILPGRPGEAPPVRRQLRRTA